MPGHRPVLRELHFHNLRLRKVGVDVLTLDELRDRGGAMLYTPRRVDFHHLLMVEAGSFGHVVDFVEHELGPGCVLMVRPGQVQQWREGRGSEGRLVLISSEAFCPSVTRASADMRLLALPDWPAVSRPGHGVFAEAVADLGRLSADIRRFEGTDLETSIIRHELVTLLLRLARALRSAPAGRETTREAEIYVLFVRELETGITRRLNVQDYSKRLGFSESTLSRACVAAAGHTAKEVIDRRIALEAKRLLVHSQETAAGIGHQLGFTEPTNFVKFFRRLVGCTPLQFRQRQFAAWS